jgi:hypothetical protein
VLKARALARMIVRPTQALQPKRFLDGGKGVIHRQELCNVTLAQE